MQYILYIMPVFFLKHPGKCKIRGDQPRTCNKKRGEEKMKKKIESFVDSVPGSCEEKK